MIDITEVALYARAWVEINPGYHWDWNEAVALYARAWVEIPGATAGAYLEMSPSTRGRG